MAVCQGTICAVQGMLTIRGMALVNSMLLSIQIVMCIVKDRMRIGPAVAKRVDADAAHTSGGPRDQRCWDSNVPFIEMNLRVPFFEMNARRDQASLENKYRLDDARDSRRRFKMADLYTVLEPEEKF